MTSASYLAFLNNPSGASAGTMDLNTLTLDNNTTPASLGWVLTEAVAINDAGTMVGLGTKNGQARAWILYPKLTE